MYIIKLYNSYYNNFEYLGDAPQYIYINPAVNFLNEVWENDISKARTFLYHQYALGHFLQAWTAYARMFTGPIANYDIFISDKNDPSFIMEMVRRGNLLPHVTASYVPQTPPNPATTTQIDDIDYDTPGEALKAYKRGKYVDWKRLANRNIK